MRSGRREIEVLAGMRVNEKLLLQFWRNETEIAAFFVVWIFFGDSRTWQYYS